MAATLSQRSISLDRLNDTQPAGSIEAGRVARVPGGVQDDEGSIHDHPSHEANEIITQSLRPVDGGYSAWKVLIAAFVFDALLWGKDSTMPKGLQKSQRFLSLNRL